MTDLEQRIIDAYISGLSSCKIGKIENIKASTICSILKRHNIDRRHNRDNSRKYTLNNDFFSLIDTEEKAYWLGFISADGYISPERKHSGPRVGISLAIIDKNHLEKFKTAIESTYPVNEYKTTASGYIADSPYARILIASDKMVADLISLGVVLQKSLVLKFYNDLDQLLVRHFIRGYFDGNGSIARNKRDYNLKICGTSEFLSSLMNVFEKPIKLYKRYKNETNQYYISIGGCNQVERILDYLYADSTIYLDRKYQRYLDFKQTRRSKQ